MNINKFLSLIGNDDVNSIKVTREETLPDTIVLSFTNRKYIIGTISIDKYSHKVTYVSNFFKPFTDDNLHTVVEYVISQSIVKNDYIKYIF